MIFLFFENWSKFYLKGINTSIPGFRGDRRGDDMYPLSLSLSLSLVSLNFSDKGGNTEKLLNQSMYFTVFKYINWQLQIPMGAGGWGGIFHKNVWFKFQIFEKKNHVCGNKKFSVQKIIPEEFYIYFFPTIPNYNRFFWSQYVQLLPMCEKYISQMSWRILTDSFSVFQNCFGILP